MQKKRGEPKLPSRFVAAPRTELELNVEGKFKLTRSAVVALSAAATLATDGSDRLDVAAGVARSDVVESVERIHAELDGYVLPNVNALVSPRSVEKNLGPR
jgi:hypothetical protein